MAIAQQAPLPLPITAATLPLGIVNRLEAIEGEAMAVSVKLITAKGHLSLYPTHDAACDTDVERIDLIASALIEAASLGALTLGEVRDAARMIRAHCADYRRHDALEDGTVVDGVHPCVTEAHEHAREIPHKVQEICEGRQIHQRKDRRGRGSARP